MTKRWMIVAGSAVSLGLGACGEEAAEAPATNAEANAQGELRGGTTSDAMLPLDQVTSQSPQMKPEPGEGGSSGGGSSQSSSSNDDASEDDAEPDPAPAAEEEPAASETAAEEG